MTCVYACDMHMCMCMSALLCVYRASCVTAVTKTPRRAVGLSFRDLALRLVDYQEKGDRCPRYFLLASPETLFLKPVCLAWAIAVRVRVRVRVRGGLGFSV